MTMQPQAGRLKPAESEREFLPFARPSVSPAAVAEVVACIESGWLTTGPRVQRFEGLLGEYHAGRRALCLNSATAGLHTALLSLNLQPGDEVITTPLTFVATLNTIIQAGGKPVLADIDPDTLNLDTSRLPQAITARTRAIVPVHFAGLPVDLDVVYAEAEAHKLRVIEDCAHAIGAEYKGKRLGAFGDVQVMSFHPNKNMTTGEGGCVLTQDAGTIAAIERLRFHGIDRDAFNRFARSGSQHYDVAAPGFKYNMLDMQAALGIHQLGELDGFVARRAQLVRRYQDALGDWPELRLPRAPAYAHRHAWHLFTPRLLDNAARLDRDGLIAGMKEQNIGLGLHYPAVHTFSWYRERYGWKSHDYPQALEAGERIFSLPLFPTLTDADQDRVIASLARVLKR